MTATEPTILYVNTITHDAKVVLVGIAAKEKEDAKVEIYYRVKRSGFEESALQDGADAFGFEPWKKLRLDESTDDPSVPPFLATKTDGTPLLQPLYGAGPAGSAEAPVQLLSVLEHLYVFRQSTEGRILVNRFVLDGMTNELVPKLEPRYRRSGQRFSPHPGSGAGSGHPAVLALAP